MKENNTKDIVLSHCNIVLFSLIVILYCSLSLVFGIVLSLVFCIVLSHWYLVLFSLIGILYCSLSLVFCIVLSHCNIVLFSLIVVQEMVQQGEIDFLVPERVWAETKKALAEITPAAYFQALLDCGALERIFPEINALFGVPQTAEYHPEIDTGLHTLMVLEQACLLTEDLTQCFFSFCPNTFWH
jgi:hypothetical protein